MQKEPENRPKPQKRKPSSWGWRLVNWGILLMGFLALAAVIYFVFAGFFVLAP